MYGIVFRQWKFAIFLLSLICYQDIQELLIQANSNQYHLINYTVYNVMLQYTAVTCGYKISGNYLPVALFLSSEGRRVTLLVTKSIQTSIQL